MDLPAVAEYWDALFPGAVEEETAARPMDDAESRHPAAVREPRAGYGIRGRGVQAGAAAAIVALAVGGALVWQKVCREKAALQPVPPTGLPAALQGEANPAAGTAGGTPATGGSPGAGRTAEGPARPAVQPNPSRDPGPSGAVSGRPRAMRRVRIETEPAGASASLEDGTELGTTPLQLDASTLEGRRLHVSLEGYERKVVPGSALERQEAFRVELDPAFGTLEAIQAIAWAKVYLGDRLAVGATDVDAGILLLRPVQLRQPRLHGFQAELDLEELQPVEKRPGLLIGHDAHCG